MEKELKCATRLKQNFIQTTGGTVYSNNPILPPEFAARLLKNVDFQRKASSDPKERRLFMVDGHEERFSRLCSERSEDLVTFTVFECIRLLSEVKPTPLDVKLLLGSQQVRGNNRIRLWFESGSMLFYWAPMPDDGENVDEYRKSLWDVIEKETPRELGRIKQRTEIDAIHINTADKTITFLDAKLKALTGKAKKEDYSKWFKERDEKDKGGIGKYFQNVEQLDCEKYYQLIRNWYWGNKIIDTDGKYNGWSFHLVHVGDINYLQDMTYYTRFKEHLTETANRTFSLTTWQNISSAAHETLGEPCRPLLEWLSNHPVTGNVYGQTKPLFPRGK